MKKIDFSVIVICFLLILLTIILPFVVQKSLGQTFFIIINPIIWTSIGVITYFMNKECSIKIRERDKKNITKTVLIITLLYIVLYYLLGLFFGFLKTPYSHSLISILKNFLSIVYILALQEYIRTFIINKSAKNKLNLILISLLFILINIDFVTLSGNITDSVNIFKYICSTILPMIASSFLLTYLSLYSKSLPGTLYRCIPKIFLILFPIVPDIDWFFTSVLEIILPFFTYIIINYYVLNTQKISKRKLKKQKPIYNVIFIIIIVVFVCFVAGIFKSMPVAVASNSMNPEFYRGDVVIINKLTSKELDKIKVGDIIQYKLDNKYVIHRVVEIIDEDNHIYTTKGDNNNVVDLKNVYPNQIVGKVIQVIPKLGYPSIFLSEIFKISPPNDIQT